MQMMSNIIWYFEVIVKSIFGNNAGIISVYMIYLTKIKKILA
jgi:hypothetical protein